jgi:Uncharacterized proteins, homologs of microcin C7 resistance protein MccF
MKTFQIGIYAPSGYVHDSTTIDRAETLLETLGHHVHRDAGLLLRDGRFAGNDDERLAAINRMRDSPNITLALAARGGYGWSRLLDKIDYRAFENDKTLWLGHSDFTAFQCALYAKTGRVSFTAPMACSDFGAETPSDFTIRHCFDLLNTDRYEIECSLNHSSDKAFSAEGILWGGNLSMIAHLIGTPYMPKIEGGILFLEDVGEAPYKIERMLYQLLYSGILQKQKAVLLGAFTQIPPCVHEHEGYTLADTFLQIEKISNVPFFKGLPFGHIPDKLTLPFGAHCVLNVPVQGIGRIEVSHYQL